MLNQISNAERNCVNCNFIKNQNKSLFRDIQQSMKINISNNVIAPKLQNMFAHFALGHVNNTNGKYVLYKRK